MNLGKVANL